MNRIKHWVLTILLFGLSVQLTAGKINGLVTDHLTGDFIEGALALLLDPEDEEFVISAVSDGLGQFTLFDIPSGRYHLEVRKEGCFSNVVFDLDIGDDETLSVKVSLLEKQDRHGDDFCFMLGGIEVKAEEKAIIPEEIETIRKIDSGEIEHSQASSLGDILSLIPGVEKYGVPGLSDNIRVGVRSVSSMGGSVDLIDGFGTTIVVDGVEISNDANAKQTGEVGSGGIDLRIIPADNIESVEVLTGIGSVEYGNFAEGMVRVKTKTSLVKPKMKLKLNPDTKTISYSAGHRFNLSEINYHFDYGYSERNLRIEGDEYHRIYFRTNLARKYWNDKLQIRPSISYTKRIDSEEPKGTRNTIEYDNGYRIASSLNTTYDKSKGDKYSLLLSLDVDDKQHYKETWVDEQIVIADSVYGGYVGVKEEIGKEWYLKAKLIRKFDLKGRKAQHKFLIGTDLDYKSNTGEGLILDTLFNYYGPYSERRSYSFDSYPGLNQYSIYAQDKVKRNILGKQFELMFGLRYDVFNPTGFNFKNMFSERAFLKSKHGDFLSPRLNLKYSITNNFIIRMGAGRSVKSVSLAHIYEAPAYKKIVYTEVDSTWVVEEVQIQQNPDLQAYSTDKYEISLDWKIADAVGITTTAYWTESDNRPKSTDYPWGYAINPDTITAMDYEIYENRGWREAWGVETNLKTQRFHGFQLAIGATYKFSHSGTQGLKYDDRPDTTYEEVWYPAYSDWYEKVIMDYKLTYISQRFGLWLTLEAQHIPLSHKQRIYNGNSGLVNIDGVDYEFTQPMSDWYDNVVYDYGEKWVFNFRLSKSLFTNTEVSLYINNVFDDRAKWRNPYTDSIRYHNSPIFYGLEMSASW